MQLHIRLSAQHKHNDAKNQEHHSRAKVHIQTHSCPLFNANILTCRIFPRSIVTTYDGDEDIHRAFEAGAQGYIIKGDAG
jgi:CheY-like chemotaxis protein